MTDSEFIGNSGTWAVDFKFIDVTQSVLLRNNTFVNGSGGNLAMFESCTILIEDCLISNYSALNSNLIYIEDSDFFSFQRNEFSSIQAANIIKVN